MPLDQVFMDNLSSIFSDRRSSLNQLSYFIVEHYTIKHFLGYWSSKNFGAFEIFRRVVCNQPAY